MANWNDATIQELQRALAAFPRAYQQIPPMHSALKQDGRPLYEYARAGITRERSMPGGKIWFRAAACAGALYPIETYVVCTALDGLSPAAAA